MDFMKRDKKEITTMQKTLAGAALGSVLALMAQVPAQAQNVEQFYTKNNQIRMIVGFNAGDGYDIWARTLGRHMGRHIPGNPIFLIQNMPGAGSVNVGNYLYEVAPKDGTVMGSFSRNLPSQALVGLKGIKFDPRKFGWVGTTEISSRVCIVLSKLPINTVEDLKKTQVVMGGTGLGSAPSFLPVVINELLDTKFKVINGYRGASDALLAMEKGETEGMCQSYSSLLGTRPHWFKDGTVRILFNTEQQRNPDLPNVPSIFESMKDTETRQLMNFFTSTSEFGRPFVAPPNLPADRLQALRAAFDATVKDPAFIEDATRQKLEVTYKTGVELEKMVNELFETPKHLIDKAIELVPDVAK
jgi:tripartite-type tricarboxylate transporter receptor subunit TctC